jgi:hypothetical protein
MGFISYFHGPVLAINSSVQHQSSVQRLIANQSGTDRVNYRQDHIV